MPYIVSLRMVGFDIANFVAKIVSELLSAFVVTKGIIVATYFQSSSLCFVAIIIFYVGTFFLVLHFILCHDIILDVATMFCFHFPCPWFRHSYKMSRHSLYAFFTIYIATQL